MTLHSFRELGPVFLARAERERRLARARAILQEVEAAGHAPVLGDEVRLALGVESPAWAPWWAS